jgi:hypothetical protein
MFTLQRVKNFRRVKNQAVAFPKPFLDKKLYLLAIVKCAQLGFYVGK